MRTIVKKKFLLPLLIACCLANVSFAEESADAANIAV